MKSGKCHDVRALAPKLADAVGDAVGESGMPDR
jgi:hypothetical protein